MKYRIALVEYLNTFPFSEGMKLTELAAKVDISRVPPAQCAQLFAEGKVDISLCPVGALNGLPPHTIQGNYCIGADGDVGTVVLLSNVPLDEITAIKLDDHSRTSNQLLQILAERLWHKDWEYYFQSDEDAVEACLMIGDKVFDHREEFQYQYDLGAAWKKLTGLPMVFAVWISRPDLPMAWIHDIDFAFEKGMELIQSGNAQLEGWQLDYLLHNISYPLDQKKREAMQLYMEWSATLKGQPVL